MKKCSQFERNKYKWIIICISKKDDLDYPASDSNLEIWLVETNILIYAAMLAREYWIFYVLKTWIWAKSTKVRDMIFHFTSSNKSGVLFIDRVWHKLLLRRKVRCRGTDHGNEGYSQSGALRRVDSLGRTGYRICTIWKASPGGNDHGHRFPYYSGSDLQ